MSKVYFDTTIFCGAFEGSSAEVGALQPVFKLAERHSFQLLTSDLTLGELLGKESDRGWRWQSRFYVNLLVHRGFIDIRPVSRDILVRTGRLRQQAAAVGRRIKLADAIHAVTAQSACCQLVFTSDKRFYVPEPMVIAAPDSAGIESVKAALSA